MSKNSPPPQNLVYKDKKIILNIHNYNIIARATHSGVPKQKSSPGQRHCSNCAEATATRLKCHSERKRGNPLNRNANLNGVLPRASFVLAITNRATTLHSQNEMDKNSNRNSVRVLAWCLACFARKWINEHLFKACLYTECAYSGCEPQGGEKANAELDV